MLSNSIKETIKKHALKEMPKECCGVLVEGEGEVVAFPCRNVSEKPEKHFSMLPTDYLKASNEGRVKAIYHSHNSTNDKFSPNDILNSKGHDLPFVLYCSLKDSFSTFDPKKSKTFLYDRIFKIGETDCYTVVKEYYKDLGIELSDKPLSRTDHTWHQQNPRLIQELFDLNKNNPNLPIMELPASTKLKKHDVLVFEFIKGAGPNHVAVYLGNDEIMHHPRNKYLCIQPLNKTLIKTISKIYRHEQFS